jgi:predicted DNA-binding antitoxin AbrB/MazE fold protein
LVATAVISKPHLVFICPQNIKNYVEKMSKTIVAVYKDGVFKPLEKVDLNLKDGEEVDISIEEVRVAAKKIEISLSDFSDFLPRDFPVTLKKLRSDSSDRFKRLGIIP